MRMICLPACLFLLETEEVGLFHKCLGEKTRKIGTQHDVGLKFGPLFPGQCLHCDRMFGSAPENFFATTIWTEVLAAVVIEQSLPQ